MGAFFAVLNRLGMGARRGAGVRERSQRGRRRSGRWHTSRLEPLEQRALLSISGQVFNDLNNNSVKDSGEPALVGWTVQLDLNNDGSVDSTALSDAGGNYTFPGVPAGTHAVSAVPNPAFAQTVPAGAYLLTTQVGVDITNQDFGFSNFDFGEIGIVNDGLDPSSDTGVPFEPATTSDRITSDTTPTFFGRAPAGSTVSLYVDFNSNGVYDSGTDTLVGQVAATADAGNPTGPGHWSITPNKDLNTDFATLGQDGLRTIFATCNDAGVSGPVSLNIFLDTAGPQIASVTYASSGQSVFGNSGGPGASDQIDIAFTDLPNRTTEFNYPALDAVLAQVTTNYSLTGQTTGTVPLHHVEFINSTDPGGPGMSTVRLFFTRSLTDDRYTLTVSDNLLDTAGNKLDGEPGATIVPSGNGIPGGSFSGSFGVDVLPELAVATAGAVQVDLNGNFVFDPQNPDPSSRDGYYLFARPTDVVFAGNFTPADAPADGFAKLGAYGFADGQFRWLIDTNGDGGADILVVDPRRINGLPVAGNFDNDASNGDEVGVFNGTTWWLDSNHDFMVDKAIPAVSKGYPLAGDFDGDGIEDLGTFADGKYSIDLGGNGYGQVDVTLPTDYLGFRSTRARPVVGDMDHDGIDDLGVWWPDNGRISAQKPGDWYFFLSEGTPINAHGAYNTEHVQFGSSIGLPVVGNFASPATVSLLAARTTAKVAGTAGNDTIVLAPGKTPGTWTLKVNGVARPIDPKTAVLNLDGLGGTNSISIIGTKGDETAEVWPDHLVFRSGSLVVKANHVTFACVNGVSGKDQILFHDSPGSDSLTISAGSAKLTGKGFGVEARSFASVRAYATAGGSDTADLYQSSGQETVSTTAPMVVFSAANASSRIRSFNKVQLHSSTGAVKNVYTLGAPAAPATKPKAAATPAPAVTPAVASPKRGSAVSASTSNVAAGVSSLANAAQLATQKSKTKATSSAVDSFFAKYAKLA